jgi:hypothetical protein
LIPNKITLVKVDISNSKIDKNLIWIEYLDGKGQPKKYILVNYFESEYCGNAEVIVNSLDSEGVFNFDTKNATYLAY